MIDYIDAVNWTDAVEKDYLQQGHRDDESGYTFDEIIEELNNARN